MTELTPGKRWSGKELNGKDRTAILLRGHFTCAYCGADLTRLPSRQVQMDHLIPIARGGRNAADNLVPACGPCNRIKCDRDWRDYAPGGAQVRILQQISEPLNYDLAAAVMRGRIRTREEAARDGDE